MMKRTLLLILAFVLTLPVFAQNKSDGILIDAVQAWTDGRYKEASAMLARVLASEPDNDAALYYKGLSDIYLGQKELGVKELRKAAALDSANYWYRDRLAVAYQMTGQDDLTLATYEQLLKDFPRKTDIQYRLVNLYLAEGRTEDALKMMDDIDLVMGKSDPTVITRYRILLQQKKPEEALEVLRDYCSEYASPNVLSMLGDHEMGMFNDSLALAYYDEALALDRDYAPARLGKAEAYRMTRKYPEFFETIGGLMDDGAIPGPAKADYFMQLLQHSDPRFLQTFRAPMDSTCSRMVAAHPADTSVLQTAGIYYFRVGDHPKARTTLRANMENNPGSIPAAGSYLQALAAMEDYHALVEEAEAAAKRFPAEPGFLEMANMGRYNLKDYEGIIECCQRILAAAPKDSAACLHALSNMGDMYHQTGDNKKAYKAYDKALKINPDYAPVLNNYAYFLSMEGRLLGKAYKMSKKTIEAEPDNATFLDTFGWILHLQGKDVEAKPFFKHAMLYGGKDSATVLLHYARVLEKLGEDDLAKVYRSQAKAKELLNPEEE